MIKVVCFDLGGVLLSTAERWQEAIHVAGVNSSLSKDDNRSFYALPAFCAHQRGDLPYADYLAELRDAFGLDSVESADLVHRSILVKPYVGTVRLIEDLKKLGLVTGCLSNTDPVHWVELTRSGRFPAVEMIDIQLGSHLIGCAKPNPFAYRAFDKASGYSGLQTVFFDDNQANVDVAREIGWFAHSVHGPTGQVNQMRLHLASYGLAIEPSFASSPK